MAYFLSRYDRVIKKAFRHESSNVCYYCNTTDLKENMQVEHKVPVSRGGKTNNENMVISCRKCNLIKSDMDEYEFNYYVENFVWEPNYEKLMIETQMYKVNHMKQKRQMLNYHRNVLGKNIKMIGFF